MNVLERMFALRVTPPFDRLHDSEIVQIASAARVREFAAGESVAPADRPLRHLVIVTEGRIYLGGEPAPAVFGEESLLLGIPLGHDAVAGSEGATCLLLLRAHFLTLFRECPWILVELMEGPVGEVGSK
jgi:signal-transduction protein with cAMP-binding, CBS, and nucleotidyltransferase domain